MKQEFDYPGKMIADIIKSGSKNDEVIGMICGVTGALVMVAAVILFIKYVMS